MTDREQEAVRGTRARATIAQFVRGAGGHTDAELLELLRAERTPAQCRELVASPEEVGLSERPSLV